MLPTICMLIAMVAGLWNVPSLLTGLPQLAHTTNSKQGSHAMLSNGSSAVPIEYQSAATTTAQRYMNALLNHQYATMWQLLHPQVQAMWPAEAAFATYWQNRFQHYTLQRFELGKVYELAHWTNPETM